MTLWLAVSADEYELPLAVAESSKELAELLNTSSSNISKRMQREREGRKIYDFLIRKVKYDKRKLSKRRPAMRMLEV